MLPVVPAAAKIANFPDAVTRKPDAVITVDLEQQSVTDSDGHVHKFEIASFQRRQLLDGMDDVALTLAFSEATASFELAYDSELPWISHHKHALA